MLLTFRQTPAAAGCTASAMIARPAKITLDNICLMLISTLCP